MRPLGLLYPSPRFFVLRSAISFQVRKRIAAFLWEPLPDDFIPPPPYAVSVCEEVSDVDHGDLNGTPSN